MEISIVPTRDYLIGDDFGVELSYGRGARPCLPPGTAPCTVICQKDHLAALYGRARRACARVAPAPYSSPLARGPFAQSRIDTRPLLLADGAAAASAIPPDCPGQAGLRVGDALDMDYPGLPSGPAGEAISDIAACRAGWRPARRRRIHDLAAADARISVVVNL